MPLTTVCAVIVTYNRKNMLKECLKAIRSQTRKPEAIYIIDNNSTDGTGQWLKEEGYLQSLPPITIEEPWENMTFIDDITVYYLRMNVNQGGAGGFHEGLKRAYLKGYDWIWLMDDDTIPKDDALGKLVQSPKFADEQTGCLASIVRWIDGSPHKMNMSSLTISRDLVDIVKKGYISTKHVSFVSALFPRHVIKEVGLPIKEFFIWYDDVEYTYRISRKFKVYYVLDSVVIHKTKVNGGAELETFNSTNQAKYMYGFRNLIIFLKGMDKPFLKKAIEIYKIFISNTFYVINNKLPLRLIGWMFKGLFFKKKIEFIS